MSTATINNQANTSQGQFVAARMITADGELIKNPVLAPAKIGALTTRSSATAGTLTMNTGHGITNGRLDIYWTNADGTTGRRWGATATVTGDSVAFTGGSGDNLPTLVGGTYAITAMVPQLEAFAYLRTNIVAFFASCQYPATVVVRNSVPAELVAAQITGASGAYMWDSANGVSTPFGTDPVEVYLSHGSPDFSAAVTAMALIN